jgi:serine/threonine-protein kinase
LSKQKPDLPSELDAIVLRCLVKNPADRPSSAFELAECPAAIPFDAAWDSQRAQAWWEENLPAATKDSTEEVVAETIFINSSDTK